MKWAFHQEVVTDLQGVRQSAHHRSGSTSVARGETVRILMRNLPCYLATLLARLNPSAKAEHDFFIL